MKKVFNLMIVFSMILMTNTAFAYKTDNVVFDVQGEGKVAWISDGDTFRIDPDNDAHIDEMSQYVKKVSSVGKHFNWGQFTVRVANVNTAESNHMDEKKNTTEGKKVSDIVKQHLDIGTRASYHCYKLGYYDRPVCNVTMMPSGSAPYDFAEWLIKNGHSPYIQKYGTNPFNHEGLLNASK